jgi:formate hydrogenlyase subunit 6/NADH:ubiquinone oxidoreductase subunit I
MPSLQPNPQAFLHSLGTLWRSLRLTWKHLRKSMGPRARNLPITHTAYFQSGFSTLQYPHERLPVPSRGRYQLHNDIDDCIVCDKCAQVCPVDCIEIEAIKSPVPLGKTSNGMTKRLYAARFDIDLAKCCFCGLCTTVCPTQCLTMTPEYDYSVFDWAVHKVSFATMTSQEITARKKAWEAKE